MNNSKDKTLQEWTNERRKGLPAMASLDSWSSLVWIWNVSLTTPAITERETGMSVFEETKTKLKGILQSSV
jgi:hypothetical protein